MANWEGRKIIDVVNDISDEVYVLPVIQRNYVWKKDQIEDLFDSIMKGYSFGGIIVIEEEKNTKPLFECRPFANTNITNVSNKIGELSKKQYFVIDGQQRLQSLYIGIYGYYTNDNGKIEKLYFNLLSNGKNMYDFDFDDEKVFFEKVKYDDTFKKCLWINVKDLVERLKNTKKAKSIMRNVVGSINLSEEEKEIVEDNIQTFINNFYVEDPLGIAKMYIDKNEHSPEECRQMVVEAFERINNGGTKLSPLELVASELKGYSYDMERFISDMNIKYGIATENLLKFCYIIQDKNPKNVFDISADDAEFIIKNRDRIEACVVSLNKFLELTHLKGYYDNFRTSFVPLFFVMYHMYHKNISNEEIKKFFENIETGNSDRSVLCKWIKLSILYGTFKSKGAGWIPYTTGINEIKKIISNYKNKEFPFDELCELFKNRTNYFNKEIVDEHFDDYNVDFMYYLMYGMEKIPRENDVDHIMPKNILEKMNYESKSINNIRNFQLLDYGTNRGEKNGKAFKIWFEHCIPEENKQLYLTTHLIPEDKNLWEECRFNDFIKKREKLILEKIKKMVYI